MQQWKKDSDLSIDNKSNISKSINSNSISSIEINTSKIYEVIEDENISKNTIINNDLDINFILREKSFKVTLIQMDLSTEWQPIKIANVMPSTYHPIPKDVPLLAIVKPSDPNSSVFHSTNSLRTTNNLPSTINLQQ